MTFTAGYAFLAPNPIQHLYVVLHVFNDPVGAPSCVVVNITTVKYATEHDPACELSADDHAWVTRKSYAFYQRAQEVRVAAIEAGIRAGSFTAQEPVSDGLLKRLRRGLHASRFSTQRFKNVVPAE